MGSSTRRRRGRRSASKAVIPSTVEKEQHVSDSPHHIGNIFSFFGSNLARPALVGNPDQGVQKLLKDNNARMHFVTPVQPLMEWAAGARFKDGGVAPQWVGKAPRKPLTAARAYLEDLREKMLVRDPSLRLLTRAEQVKVAKKSAAELGEPVSFNDLSKDRQREYTDLAMVDQKRYIREAAEYEKLNPGWREFEESSRKHVAKHQVDQRPRPPLNAQQLFAHQWLKEQGAAQPPTEEMREDARKQWDAMSGEQQQPFEADAAEAEKRYEASLEAWTKRRNERRAKRRAQRASAAKDATDAEQDEHASLSQSATDTESEDEVAAARWGPKVHESPQAKTTSPAVRVTRSFRGAASEAANTSLCNDVKSPRDKSSHRTTEAAQLPRRGKGRPEAAAAARKPAMKRGNEQDAENTQEGAGKRSRTSAADAAAPTPKSIPKANTQQQAIHNAFLRTEAHMQAHPSKRPPAFPTDPAALIGSSVRDTFLNEEDIPQVYSGKVTKFEFARITAQGLTPLWEVTFEDGDCGEKEWHELKDILCEWPPKGL